MSDKNRYSDEYINAFIDGELDSNECAQVLFDEQQNDVLAQKINEMRMLKEKVQLAYAGFEEAGEEIRSDSSNSSGLPYARMLASVLVVLLITGLYVYQSPTSNGIETARQLIRNTQATPAYAVNTVVGMNEHVVINLSQYQPAHFSETLEQIKALLQKRNSASFSLEIVANGKGLKALDTETSLHVDEIKHLSRQFANLKVVACAKSLAQLASEGDPVKLLKGIMLTPSAAEQVAKRTSQGWLYIKL